MAVLEVKQSKKAAYRKELERIRKTSDDGKLRPRDVVDEAADPDHLLHSEFEWDDEKAADEHRLAQARELIRCVIVSDAAGREMPAYVSLIEDRQEPGGGYRSTEDILDSKPLMAQWRATAERELAAWMHRNQVVTDLVNAVSDATGIPSPAAAKKKRKGR